MALGLGYNFSKLNNITDDHIREVHKKLFQTEKAISIGMRSSTRLSKTIKTGRDYFQ
jgi:hypothetical protein